MYCDPAKYFEDRQSYDLAKACKPCAHHSYGKDGVRVCKQKQLTGNDLSICGEFKPKPMRAGMARLKMVFCGYGNK